MEDRTKVTHKPIVLVNGVFRQLAVCTVCVHFTTQAVVIRNGYDFSVSCPRFNSTT